MPFPQPPEHLARQRCPKARGQPHRLFFRQSPPDLTTWWCERCTGIWEIHESIGQTYVKLESPQLRLPLSAWDHIARHLPRDGLGEAVIARIEKALSWQLADYRRRIDQPTGPSPEPWSDDEPQPFRPRLVDGDRAEDGAEADQRRAGQGGTAEPGGL